MVCSEANNYLSLHVSMCKAARLEIHLTRRSVSRDLTEAKEFFSQTDVAIEASATSLSLALSFCFIKEGKSYSLNQACNNSSDFH